VNVRRIYSITLVTLLLVGAAAVDYARPGNSTKTGEVKVYLVALGDNGKKGKKIGCEDSLVAVKRKIKPTAAPLRAALGELLSMPKDSEAYSGLSNYWAGNNLRLKSVVVRRGTATIHIVGEGPSIAGICDEPRVISQIEETARQFPTVKRVRVFVNGQRLEDAVR
jgi:spore germination protein GerM